MHVWVLGTTDVFRYRYLNVEVLTHAVQYTADVSHL